MAEHPILTAVLVRMGGDLLSKIDEAPGASSRNKRICDLIRAGLDLQGAVDHAAQQKIDAATPFIRAEVRRELIQEIMSKLKGI